MCKCPDPAAGACCDLEETLSEGADAANIPILNAVFKLAGGRNYRLKAAPEQTLPIVALANGANVNLDFPLTEEGNYDFAIEAKSKVTAGTGRTNAARRCGTFSAGALTLEGATVTVDLGGNAAGVTLTITASGANLRVNVANATGNVLNGDVYVGWALTDLIT